MKKITILVFSLLLLICPKFVDALGISNATIELEEGQTQQLQITDQVAELEYTVEWITNKSDVATVSDNGTVTANAEGTAIITATVKHKNPENQEEFIDDGQYSCTVTVTKEEEEPVTAPIDYRIIIKGGKLDKDFDKNTTNYEVEVTDINNFEISVTPSTARKNIPGYSDLRKVGVIRVTVEGKEYKFKINVPTENTYLASLKVPGYAFNQTFDKDTLSYTLRVDYDVTEIKIEATAEDAKAKVSGTGSFALEVGSQTFTITVTNGSDTRTYRIFVTRDEEEYEEKKTKTISRTSKDASSDLEIPDVEDPDSPISIGIIVIGSLVLFSIGGFGIYFFAKTSPKRLKKEILRKQKNQDESPIVEINNNSEVEEPTKEFK